MLSDQLKHLPHGLEALLGLGGRNGVRPIVGVQPQLIECSQASVHRCEPWGLHGGLGPLASTEASEQPEMLPPAGRGRAHGDPHRLEAGVVGQADTGTVLLLSVHGLGSLRELGGRLPSTLGFPLIHAQIVPHLGLVL